MLIRCSACQNAKSVLKPVSLYKKKQTNKQTKSSTAGQHPENVSVSVSTRAIFTDSIVRNKRVIFIRCIFSLPLSLRFAGAYPSMQWARRRECTLDMLSIHSRPHRPHRPHRLHSRNMGNRSPPVTLTRVSPDCGRKAGVPGGDPRRHGENTQTPTRDAPRQNSNTGPYLPSRIPSPPPPPPTSLPVLMKCSRLCSGIIV